MTIKKYFLSICYVFIATVGIVFPARAMYFSDFLYQNIRNNSMLIVNKYLRDGYSINAVNERGMTALCLAIEKNDYSSYRKLLDLGAKDNPKCLKNINRNVAKDFNNRYNKLNSVPDEKIVVSEKSSTNYAAVGVVLAGAGAAALLLDSGGGSSSHYVPENPGDGSNENPGDKPDDGSDCPTGQEFVIDECLPICPTGTRRNGKDCEQIECPTNTHLVGNLCVADENIEIENNSDVDVFGVVSDKETVFNLYSVPKYPDDKANINIKNKGNADVYGLYGTGDAEVFNAFIAGYDSNGGVNKTPGTANINIESDGSGNVYGIYSQIDDATDYKEAMNIQVANEGVGYGNINITQTGGGTAYGVFGDVRAYNTYAMYGGQSYGDITIHGDGDIYGVGGFVVASNAISPFYGNKSVGNINLYSTGDGDIYGMSVNKAGIPGAGAGGDENLNSWFAFNAYASGGDTVEGNIYIHNVGDGNVYGMHGGQQLYNAQNFGFVENEAGTLVPTGVAIGKINIANFGNGDVYGMYMPETDSSGKLENRTGDGAESYINIVNTGSGVATGLRGGELVNIVNTGEININNVGNGTAIGIYGEQGSSVYNNGLINIYRDNYEDEETGVTHYATQTGGVAYGIYAEKGARVTNDIEGKIIISNASSGAGVYLEEGATLTNDGEIVFNDNSNNIVENGDIIDIYGENDRTLEGASVNLSLLGDGKVVLGTTGKFFAEELSGKMEVTSEAVLDSFNDEYVLDGALQVKNVDNLNLVSQSAMFEASKSNSDNGIDVVLTRKNFGEFTNNGSLAQFLESNYQKGNGEEVYNVLKSQKTSGDVANAISDVAGEDILPHFRKEDKLVYSHLSREFNDNLFKDNGKNYFGGYKYMDISTDKDGRLVGSDSSVHAAYGMLKDKADNGVVYGLGATIAQIDSDYDDGSSRKNNVFGLWLPVGYDFSNGAKWYSKLYAAYGDGSYDRKTLLGTYSADVKEYQLGLSNEVRYNLSIGKGFNFEPLAELNLLNIYQKSFDEGDKEGAFDADNSNSLSLETGIGAYLSKKIMFNEDNELAIRIGGIYYVEFLNPDDGIKGGLKGIDGKYKIAHKEDSSRAVLSCKFDYRYKDMSLYAILEQETGGNEAFTVDVGAQYNF